MIAAISILAMAFGFTGFGRMGALQHKQASGGPPIPGTPTFYIYGF